MSVGISYFGGKQSHLRHILPLIDGAGASAYIEPYFGGGAVFFNKAPHLVNIINDISGEVVNFFRVLRDQPAELVRVVELTPYARDEFAACLDDSPADEIERARRFLFTLRASTGNAGKQVPSNFTQGIMTRADGRWGRGYYRRWMNTPATLLTMAERLKDCVIENRDALRLIKKHDRPGALFYLDPPYLPDTISTNSRKRYPTHADHGHHEELIATLVGLRHARFVLSGYPSDIYAKGLADFETGRYQSYTASAGTGRNDPREEVLWWSVKAPKSLIF